MKALVIGHSSYDISCLMNDYPQENNKYYVTEKNETGGGQAANEASLLAKWGVETYLAAAVGADSYGERVKKELDMIGVKNDYIETIFDKSTSTSFIIINKKTGARTIINIASNDMLPHLKKEDYKIDIDLLLIDGYEYHASMAALKKYSDKKTIIDAGKVTPETTELSKYCKYIVASKNYAEELTGIKINYEDPNSLLNLYTKLKERYTNNELIVTLEEKGALYMINNQVKIMPGIAVKVVDTTGAGDVFHGAFAYSILNNYDLEKAITFSNIAAGLSCEVVGGKLSIPALNNVINYYNSRLGVNNEGANTNQQNPPA